MVNITPNTPLLLLSQCMYGTILHRLAICFSLISWSGTYANEDPSPESLRRGARLGDLELVKQAIEAKVEIDCQTDYGVTPLSLACDHGHQEIVKYLLENGADPNIKDRFYRVGPMGWALSRNREEIVKLLVDGGCKDIDSSLAQAVTMRSQEIIKHLIASKNLTKEGLQAAWKTAKAMKDGESIAALLEEILPEADRPTVSPASEPTSDSVAFQPFVGTYKNEAGNELVVAIKDNLLTVRQEESEQVLVLTLVDADHFQGMGMDFIFVRDHEKVTSMKFKIGDRDMVYQFQTANAPSMEDKESDNEIPTEAPRPDYPMDSPNWPSFRGTLARGISDVAQLPLAWDGESGKNIAWKTPIPGLATSSPIVWGNRVFITTAIRESDKQGFRVGAYGDVESENFQGECQYEVLCLDLETGNVVWKDEAFHGVPKVKRHSKSSHANPTPATDGTHVIASFGGEGIYAYTTEGKKLWDLQLGTLDSGWFYDPTYQWGFGSSPFIFEDMVILQCDVQEGSFIVAIDVSTGKEKWRTNRNEIPTWSSPVAFMDPQGQPTVVVAGTKRSAAYNARTGEELWSLGGFSEIMVPTPQITPYSILVTSGYAPVQPIVALDHGAHGELKMPGDKKGTAPFQWNSARGGPYMPTPIVHRDKLYVLDNGGILSGYSMKNGTRIFRKRVRNEDASAFTASPVLSNGHLYAVSEIGVTFVVALDADLTVVAENKLGESVLASPAVAGKKLLIRGENHLFAIEEK